jgi:sulfur-carrier protein
MPVTFHIPGALREFTAGHSRVEIEYSPTTLADALAALWTLYPGVRDRIATEQGQVRAHINIFIGNENVRYTGGLASPVSAGSEISIVPAISGGSIGLIPGQSADSGPDAGQAASNPGPEVLL